MFSSANILSGKHTEIKHFLLSKLSTTTVSAQQRCEAGKYWLFSKSQRSWTTFSKPWWRMCSLLSISLGSWNDTGFLQTENWRQVSASKELLQFHLLLTISRLWIGLTPWKTFHKEIHVLVSCSSISVTKKALVLSSSKQASCTEASPCM